MSDPSTTSDLLTYVRSRDVLCPICKASLRDLATSQCPHCREELQLSLTLADPKVKLWLTCTLPLLFCAGVGTFILPGFIRNGFTIRGSGADAFLATSFLICIPLGLFAVLLRSRFNRLPRRTRITLAVVSLCVPLVLFGGLASLL